jgi:hypothetical protein
MRTLFKKALKKQPALNLALLDATHEEPNKILGRIVNLHRTRSMALIDEMDFYRRYKSPSKDEDRHAEKLHASRVSGDSQ